MLEPFVRDMRLGTREGLLRAALRMFHLSCAAIALPGLLLGGIYALTQPQPIPLRAVLGLAGIALLLGGLALHLARRAANDVKQPASRAALTAAIQAGTVPAVPWLIGCTFFAQPLALLLLWAVAGLLYATMRAQLPNWVREPEKADGKEDDG